MQTILSTAKDDYTMWWQVTEVLLYANLTTSKDDGDTHIQTRMCLVIGH